MKRAMVTALLFAAAFFVVTGYSGGVSSAASPAFVSSKLINVVSREEGSGTRGAFIELFGVEVKNNSGGKKDMTTKEAIVANQTSVVMTNIARDKYAIGYISLGSLNDTVKAVRINGVTASAENVKNGSYSIARPFNIATKGKPTGLAKDFIDFILSSDGQAIAAKSYIPINSNAGAFTGNRPSGKIVVAGSSSVTPVMEKLKEAYIKINPNAVIEIQESDSTAGMTAAIDGTCDIGMASRALKESELSRLTPTKIAIDGIAVIVNRVNPLTTLTNEQVQSIYMGKTEKWNAVIK